MVKQDRIIGYFLDESQEHLRVIEEGLITPSLLSQPAQIKEVFRAAHSIKGGAAMLELDTIRQIGHHFEQAFKQIKEKSLFVDEPLQNLMLEGFEILRLSIQILRQQQMPPTSLAQEPVFEKMRIYIDSRDSAAQPIPDHADFLPDPAIEEVFGTYVNRKLIQFLEISDQSQAVNITRQDLSNICRKIGNLGDRFDFTAWTNLLTSCQLAINNPQIAILQLRETIPSAIKQAQVLIIAGKQQAITSTPELAELIASVVVVPIDLNQHHDRANFMIDPQIVSTEPDIYNIDEFMQLFDEDLPVDGTWVQDEDVLQAEDFFTLDSFQTTDSFVGNEESPQSAALWDKDIAERPLPQFSFEDLSEADLFIEDEAKTDCPAILVNPTSPDIDWSGLLADIPDVAIVDYQEPVTASPTENSWLVEPDLDLALHQENSSDWNEDPFALIGLDFSAQTPSDLELDNIFNDLPRADDPPNLPTLDELMAKSLNEPSTNQQMKPLNTEEWQELAMFDDLLADTQTTDVDMADLNQIVINGNLDPELELEELENLSDFSQASVGSNKIDALDNFLTEAKSPLIDLENLNSFTETPMLPGDISIDDIQLSGEFADLDLEMLDLTAASDLNNDNFASLDLSFLADQSMTSDVSSAELNELNLDDLEIFDPQPLATDDELNSAIFAALDLSFAPASLPADLQFADIDLDTFSGSSLDELDALLAAPHPIEPQISFDSLDKLLVTAPAVNPTNQDNDEFQQIEKMLQHSDGHKSERPIANKPAARSKKQRTFEQTMRVSVKSLNNLNNLAGELVVNRNTLEQDQNRLRLFVDKLLLEVQNMNEVGKSMQDLYEKSLLESSLLANRQHQQTKSAAPSEYDAEGTMAEIEYDPLEMDRFTPIHLISQQMIELTVRIRESTSDIEFVVDNSTEVTRSLRQINSQLQEDLNKSRMLQFAQTADRLQRGVRDNGLKYGKQVELHVEGRDTMIDKVILESLNDPLVHMVNNAIAHGIESPETRLAAGKPALGSITIRALHQGTQTIISITDDGAGIDIERVKAKAIENGVINAARAVTMTKSEVYDLLFLPSFSTKDQADELAGRGVGMDVVLTSLQEIRGTITTESILGQGTTFTIRLPLALSIAKSLIAVNKDASIAFPMDGIEDSQDIKPEAVVTNEAGQKCFSWRNQLMPFRPLSDLLSFNRPTRRISYYNHLEEEEELVSLIVLRSGGNLIAVEVDRVIGEQEIVIKPLQGPAPKPVGIAGATVLGDGRIIPIADVVELIDLANGVISKQNSGLWSLNVVIDEQPAQREPMVLVVDDSITVRQLLSLTFTRAGYRVEQARDGQEAWDKLRAGLPCDIIFCDIEMPRMDGLELLAKVQQDETLKKLPMAMLTSRGSDRHRQIASDLGASGYFIKPYLEDALLAAVKRMMNGEVLAIV
jgi:chemotaxis protein histidine kinase CheA/ActR/RegA family two-component response regulator